MEALTGFAVLSLLSSLLLSLLLLHQTGLGFFPCSRHPRNILLDSFAQVPLQPQLFHGGIELKNVAVDQIRIDNIFQVIISILQCTCGLVEVILKKCIVFILCIFLL